MNADKKPNSDLVWNLATVFVLALIPMVLAIGLAIFFEPQSVMNPLPPPTLPARLVLPTFTPTPLSMPPTWTPSNTDQPAASPTSEPVLSATPDFTVISGTPIASLENPEPTETTSSGYFSFEKQSDPQAISAALYDSTGPATGWAWPGGSLICRTGRLRACG